MLRNHWCLYLWSQLSFFPVYIYLHGRLVLLEMAFLCPFLLKFTARLCDCCPPTQCGCGLMWRGGGRRKKMDKMEMGKMECGGYNFGGQFWDAWVHGRTTCLAYVLGCRIIFYFFRVQPSLVLWKASPHIFKKNELSFSMAKFSTSINLFSQKMLCERNRWDFFHWGHYNSPLCSIVLQGLIRFF